MLSTVVAPVFGALRAAVPESGPLLAQAQLTVAVLAAVVLVLTAAVIALAIALKRREANMARLEGAPSRGRGASPGRGRGASPGRGRGPSPPRAGGDVPDTEAPSPPRSGAERAGALLCPTCERRYPEGLRYCPRDARELVSAAAGDERASPGATCPRCRRAYEAGLRYCARDGSELVPSVVASRATAAGEDGEDGEDGDDGDDGDEVPPEDGHENAPSSPPAAGVPAPSSGAVMGRICPQCRRHYELGASFCGRDGSELAALN